MSFLPPSRPKSSSTPTHSRRISAPAPTEVAAAAAAAAERQSEAKGEQPTAEQSLRGRDYLPRASKDSEATHEDLFKRRWLAERPQLQQQFAHQAEEGDWSGIECPGLSAAWALRKKSALLEVINEQEQERRRDAAERRAAQRAAAAAEEHKVRRARSRGAARSKRTLNQMRDR
jgi:hypothetical protein